MVIAKRNMMGGGELPVPYDAELQYAIRANYSWRALEIPFKATEKSAYEIRVKYLERTSARALFGARDSTTVANVSNTLTAVDFGNYRQTRKVFSTSAGDVIVIKNSAKSRSVTINDGPESKTESEYTGAPFVGTYNLYLGGVNGQSSQGMEGYYYYAKIWEDGVLLFDLIPVRVGELAYWYNKVTNELMDYSETFTAGPDKT